MHAPLPEHVKILLAELTKLAPCPCGCGILAPAHLYPPRFLAKDLRGHDGAMDGYAYTARMHRRNYLAGLGPSQIGSTPEARRARKPRWPLAAFLRALRDSVVSFFFFLSHLTRKEASR